MSTIQRLTEADVEGIFGYLHGCNPRPEHLKFQIVPVGPSGLRLSPPAIEFGNGLYVLLRPERKERPKPKVPPHLLQYVVKAMPEQACPWSLSGPQFPTPTKLQQRYCYPKGDPAYSSQKGGALWTVYDSEGKEDLTYRLLHVYFSAKRAGIRSATPSPARRRRRVSTPTSASSSVSSKTKSPSTTPVPNIVPTSPWPPRGAMPPRPYWQSHHHHHHHPHYPTVPATLVHPTPPPPMRPTGKHYLPTPPPPAPAYKRHKADIPTPPPTRSMMTNPANTANPPGSHPGNNIGTEVFVEKAAKMPSVQDEDEDGWWMMGGTGGAVLEAPELSLLDHDDEMALRTKLSFELLPFATMEDSRLDNLLLLDAEERVSRSKDDSKMKKDSPLDTPTNLQKRLEIMHLHLMEWIQQHPKEKQPRLHQMVRKWAEKLQSELDLKVDDDGDKKAAAAPRTDLTTTSTTTGSAPSNKESSPVRTPITPTNGTVPIKMEPV